VKSKLHKAVRAKKMTETTPIKFIAECLFPRQEHICQQLGIEIAPDYARSYGEIVAGCVTDFSVHCFNSHTLNALKNLDVSRATLHPELNLPQIRDIDKSIPTEIIIYGKIPMMRLGNAMGFAPKTPAILTDRKGANFFAAQKIRTRGTDKSCAHNYSQDTEKCETDSHKFSAKIRLREPHECVMDSHKPAPQVRSLIPHECVTDSHKPASQVRSRKSHECVIYNSVPIFMADKLREIEETKITHGRLIFTTETDDEIRAIIGAYKNQTPLKIPFTRGKFYSKV